MHIDSPFAGVADVLRAAVNGRRSLTIAESRDAVTALFDGSIEPTLAAAWLGALRARGETIDEIDGCVQAIVARRPALSPRARSAMDIGGTGGDGVGTFNISTTAAFVVAGAGVPVIKHGNRGVSSRCGSADLMEGLGIDVRRVVSESFVEHCMASVGMAYLCTSSQFGYPEHVCRLRRELRIPTLFNAAGPLCHPGGIDVQFLGITNPDATQAFAEVLKRRGRRAAWVCASLDGLDEISPNRPTRVSMLRAGRVETRDVMPGDFELPTHELAKILGGDRDRNVQICRDVLAGRSGAARDTTVMCAAASLYIWGKASDLREASALAQRSIDNGAAQAALDCLVEAYRAL